jgi:hypothetical protein
MSLRQAPKMPLVEGTATSKKDQWNLKGYQRRSTNLLARTRSAIDQGDSMMNPSHFFAPSFNRDTSLESLSDRRPSVVCERLDGGCLLYHLWVIEDGCDPTGAGPRTKG